MSQRGLTREAVAGAGGGSFLVLEMPGGAGLGRDGIFEFRHETGVGLVH